MTICDVALCQEQMLESFIYIKGRCRADFLIVGFHCNDRISAHLRHIETLLQGNFFFVKCGMKQCCNNSLKRSVVAASWLEQTFLKQNLLRIPNCLIKFLRRYMRQKCYKNIIDWRKNGVRLGQNHENIACCISFAFIGQNSVQILETFAQTQGPWKNLH